MLVLAFGSIVISTPGLGREAGKVEAQVIQNCFPPRAATKLRFP